MRVFLLLFLASFACCAARVFAADPVWVRASFATPASGVWRTPEPLIVRVDVGLRGDDAPEAGLTLARGRLLTLTLSDADGKALNLDWDAGAGSTSAPLQVFPGQRRTFFFALTNQARYRFDPPPGRYTLRATLQSVPGTGWQGRVESAPLAITVADEVLPEVTASIANAGELTPGDPLLVELAFIATPQFGNRDGYAAPDFTERSWLEGVALDMRNAAGEPVSLRWADPLVSPKAGDRQVRKGKRFGPIWLRVPAAATQNLPAGDYTLAVRINRPAGREPIQVSPVAIKVLTPAAATQADARTASVLLALTEARALRQRLQSVRSFLSWQERLMTEAAAALKRVAPLADTLAREQPDSPRAALLQAEVLFAMANAPAASAAVTRIEAMPGAKEATWAAAIAGLRRRLAAPATETDRYFEPYWIKALGAARPVEARAPPATASIPAGSHPATTNPSPAQTASAAPTPEIDAAAQWAVSARASSEYSATNYSAEQATGLPNVARHGDSRNAWTPKAADLGEEWIELTYARPVHATGVSVVQSFNPGAIFRVEVVDVAGAVASVWSGPDTTVYAKNEIGLLVVQFPRTATPITKVKVVLDSKKIAGWNEIDAVALSGVAP